jgi:hypothetical protein
MELSIKVHIVDNPYRNSMIYWQCSFVTISNFVLENGFDPEILNWIRDAVPLADLDKITSNFAANFELQRCYARRKKSSSVLRAWDILGKSNFVFHFRQLQSLNVISLIFLINEQYRSHYNFFTVVV